MTKAPGSIQQLFDHLDDQAAARLETNVAAELAWLRRIWQGSPAYGVGALLGAVALCTKWRKPLPLWLARAVMDGLRKGVPAQRLRVYVRWRLVRRMRDKRSKKVVVGPGFKPPNNTLEKHSEEIGYLETFEIVAERLKGTLLAGSARAMRHSYETVESTLPDEAKYRRTYKRRQRR